VAQSLGVDPKTVQRWLGGRVPHARHRWGVADLLSLHEYDLWPHLADVPSIDPEVYATYPHRGSVRREIWHRLGQAEELHVTTARPDGSLRPWVPIWVVRVGDNLLVRSYRGPDGAWYRHATHLPQGRVRAGGLGRDVAFEPADTTSGAVDEAYRAKYGRYAGSDLDPMLTDRATIATLRVRPR
jgi:hypothetical protein